MDLNSAYNPSLSEAPDFSTPNTEAQIHTGLEPYAASLYSHDPYDGMPPPAEVTYPSLPDLMNACQEHGRQHGYACVTSSNNYKRGIAYVRCDRGGKYVNHWHVTPETRVRQNRTRRLVGCKWKARAKRVGENGEWQLMMMHDKHTGHGPSGDLTAHPSLRQLPNEAVDAARTAFADGKSPKEVLETLRGWNGHVTAQDVYNLKAKLVRKGGNSSSSSSVCKRRIRKSHPHPPSQEASSSCGHKGDLISPSDVTVDPALSTIESAMDQLHRSSVMSHFHQAAVMDPFKASEAAGFHGMDRLQEAVTQMHNIPMDRVEAEALYADSAGMLKFGSGKSDMAFSPG